MRRSVEICYGINYEFALDCFNFTHHLLHFQMILAIQVLRFHLLELEKVCIETFAVVKTSSFK